MTQPGEDAALPRRMAMTGLNGLPESLNVALRDYRSAAKDNDAFHAFLAVEREIQLYAARAALASVHPVPAPSDEFDVKTIQDVHWFADQGDKMVAQMRDFPALRNLRAWIECASGLLRLFVDPDVGPIAAHPVAPAPSPSSDVHETGALRQGGPAGTSEGER